MGCKSGGRPVVILFPYCATAFSTQCQGTYVRSCTHVHTEWLINRSGVPTKRKISPVIYRSHAGLNYSKEKPMERASASARVCPPFADLLFSQTYSMVNRITQCWWRMNCAIGTPKGFQKSRWKFRSVWMENYGFLKCRIRFSCWISNQLFEPFTCMDEIYCRQLIFSLHIIPFLYLIVWNLNLNLFIKLIEISNEDMKIHKNKIQGGVHATHFKPPHITQR